MNLVKERDEWAYQLAQGSFEDPIVLKHYRNGRGSETFRLSRELEKLCEKILYLETEVDFLKETIRALSI